MERLLLVFSLILCACNDSSINSQVVTEEKRLNILKSVDSSIIKVDTIPVIVDSLFYESTPISLRRISFNRLKKELDESWFEIFVKRDSSGFFDSKSFEIAEEIIKYDYPYSSEYHRKIFYIRSKIVQSLKIRIFYSTNMDLRSQYYMSILKYFSIYQDIEERKNFFLVKSAKDSKNILLLPLPDTFLYPDRIYKIKNKSGKRLLLFTFYYPFSNGSAVGHRDMIAYDFDDNKIIFHDLEE
jgi:hypothetical protein